MMTSRYVIVPIDAALRRIEWKTGVSFETPTSMLRALELMDGWQEIDDPESVSDLEIYRQMIDGEFSSPEVLIITDRSYMEGCGAFAVKSHAMSEFVSMFRLSMGERLFGGDVLIADPSIGKVWAFHHEGVYGVFEL